MEESATSKAPFEAQGKQGAAPNLQTSSRQNARRETRTLKTEGCGTQLRKLPRRRGLRMEETAPLKAPFEAQGKQGAAPAPSEVTHASVSPRDGDGRKATSSPGNSRPLTETMMPISGRRTVFRFGRSAAAFSAAAFGFV